MSPGLVVMPQHLSVAAAVEDLLRICFATCPNLAGFDLVQTGVSPSVILPFRVIVGATLVVALEWGLNFTYGSHLSYKKYRCVPSL